MTRRLETLMTRTASIVVRARRGRFGGAMVGGLVVWLLAFAPFASAGVPTHLHREALDIGGFNHACGTAVDSKGDVYVAGAGESKIKVFDPAHAELAFIENIHEPCGLAVDTKGNLYASEKATGKVVKYAPAEYPFTGTPSYGVPVTIDASGSAKGIAVDPADNRLYVAEGNHIAAYKADGGFEANLGEPLLGQATGVAAYTYGSGVNAPLYLFAADAETDQVKIFSGNELGTLKLRRTISGVDQDRNPETPDQSFGFGTTGAYLAADPGNEEVSAHKCAQVAEQACTAGHFFFYDAPHDVIDEFDASGEYLDQFTNTALAGAEPTAIAVDRSGGVNDGTIYASSGVSSGAKLLAFGPLVFPGRAPLGELSHVLAKAIAVATDPNGDVYVAAAAVIYVYGPDGKELTSFEDAGTGNARDLAVDSHGNVYVVDGQSIDPAQSMTYYAPSAYPPTSETSYSRHAPSIVGSGGRIVGIAVNPADDHLFLLRNKPSSLLTEFKSAKGGSGEVRQCIGGPEEVNVVDIGVYGADGSVDIAYTGSKRIAVVRCETAGEAVKVVRNISGGGCPSGQFNSNQALAVDQSNGHILEFAVNQGGTAREYDAVGACVAEFGLFSDTTSTAFNVAVDSSCAIHDPPLTEATTPTCKEFDASNGNVYVAYDANNNEVQPNDLTAFGPLSYGEAPIASTGIANGFGPGAVTLNGTVDPRGFELEDCHFEYLTDAEYEQNELAEDPVFEGSVSKVCAESVASIGHDTGPVPVHVDISGGIDPETTRYRYRLVAGNKYGESDGDAGLFGPPVLTAKKALPVLYDEATLRGEIDPSGLATRYHFEYGMSEGYGQSTPEAEIPPGDAAVSVQAPLIGLAEGTEYHFRLVAENTAATVDGLDGTFETLERRTSPPCPNTEYRTGLSANLPRCRAYELVTPADTRGGEPTAFPPGNSTVTGAIFNNWLVNPRGIGAGESVAFFAGTLPGFDGMGENDGYRAHRAGGEGLHPAKGWSTELSGPSYAQVGGGVGNNQEGVGSDQRYWLWNVSPAETFEETLSKGKYLRTPVGTANPECNNPETENPQGEFELIGCGSLGVDPQAESRFVSAGGAHVVFFSKVRLEDEAGNEAAPDGTQSIYDRAAGTASDEVVSVKPDGSPFGAGEDATYVGSNEDGSAVLFKVGAVLYLHRAGQTTEIAEAPFVYAGIADDGGRVFYVKAASGESPAGIFACDVEAGPCAGPGAQAPTEIAASAIFVNVSPHGSHVFFTSKEALTPPGEENENHEHAILNEHNLYTWDGSSTGFVAILDAKDFSSFGGESGESMGSWTAGINPGGSIGRDKSPTRSTPDGRVLVFQSHAQLTSFENEGLSEVYRYTPAAAPGEQLVCVSCDPSRASPGGDALLQIFTGIAGGYTEPTTLIPNVTDDGEAVFFQSPDRLLPEDANGANDVYEWRARGAGDGPEECKRADGCLALISSGQGEGPSYLYGMSADGHDVFIETREKLVGADIPGSTSIYDARVGGGIPDPPIKAPCQGDACQGQGSTPPALASPASTADVPNGNVPSGSPKCTKGKRKAVRGGKTRCIARHGKHRHNRRSHR